MGNVLYNEVKDNDDDTKFRTRRHETDDNDQHRSVRTYSQLLNMGFEESLSLTAAQKFPDNIHNAIEWIVDNQKEPYSSTEIKCSGNDCAAINRIIEILNAYNEWLYNEKNKRKNSVTKYLTTSLNTFSTRYILTHYHHIKNKRHNLSSLHISCTHSTKCIPLRRHKRDNNKNYTRQYFGNNVREIIMQKMLDQIHLFIYHPLTENDKMSNNKVNKRFGTNVMSNKFEQNEPSEQKSQHLVDDEKKENNLQQDVYSFGQQFFYWNYSKNHKWFVKQKYNDLKDELLHNDIYKIDPFIWNLEYQTALNKLSNDETVKSLKSNSEFKDKYDIEANMVITINHLLSILCYCNTNELQNRFSATYRRFNNTNESDDELKKRHRNYYHFGKLLRETVEVFGQVIVEDELSLYHGID
eukprot:106940_1